MVEADKAVSGRIPSSSIPAIMWAIAAGANNADSLWKKLVEIDPGLHQHYQSNADECPYLEGFDDGLLVISWDHNCIESFQIYQQLRYHGQVMPHNGTYSLADQEAIEYRIDNKWNIIDHHFEESRH